MRLLTENMRFKAIWLALIGLLLISALVAPRSLQPTVLFAILPLAAFLTITSMGQAMVLMMRGIDMSVPAIVALSSTLVLGVSGGSDTQLFIAIVAAIFGSIFVGLVNGFFIVLLQLNALIVTISTGTVLAGITLWYMQQLPAEAGVPDLLADFGNTRYLNLNVSVWIAVFLIILMTVILRKTVAGRKFSAVGVNPKTAHINGVNTELHQISAYAVAGALYGIAGILLAAFLKNPTLEVGSPYLLAPIAAAALGGTAMSGGVGSMISIAGAALFLTQLDQMLKTMGVPTSFQMILQGAAIALGMGMSQFRLPFLKRRNSL